VNKPAQAPPVRNMPFKLAKVIPKIVYFECEERGEQISKKKIR
jgi:hypothetical protein